MEPEASIPPRHIAIIMDGNGRWAEARGRPRIEGHRAGAKAVRPVVEAAARCGVEVLTLYSFSTENWSRPKAEISALMALFEDYMSPREIGWSIKASDTKGSGEEKVCQPACSTDRIAWRSTRPRAPR